MRITGIDLGQVAGFFRLDTERLDAVLWGTFEARKGRGDGEGAMFMRLQNRLDALLDDRPDLVTFEDVRFVVPKMRGQLVQVRMGAIVQMRCEQLGLEYAGVNVSTLKKFATDRGRAKKWEMEAALHSWWTENLDRLWPDGISSHAVDAAWTAIWGWKVHAPTLAGLEF